MFGLTCAALTVRFRENRLSQQQTGSSGNKQAIPAANLHNLFLYSPLSFCSATFTVSSQTNQFSQAVDETAFRNRGFKFFRQLA